MQVLKIATFFWVSSNAFAAPVLLKSPLLEVTIAPERLSVLARDVRSGIEREISLPSDHAFTVEQLQQSSDRANWKLPEKSL